MTTPVPGVMYTYNGAGLWVAPGYPSLSATVEAETNLEYRQSLVVGALYPKPDDITCGLLLDVPLTSSGGITAASGQTYENLDFAGNVTIASGTSNVTFRNCRFRGTTTAPTGDRGLANINASTSTSNIVFEDCLFQPDVPHYRWSSGITGHNFTARRCTVRNTTDGFGIFNGGAPGTNVNVSVVGCWVDRLVSWYPDGGAHTDGTHNDGTQIQGGFGIDFTNTWINPNLHPTLGNTGGQNVGDGGVPLVPPNYTGNACIQLNKNVGNMGDLTVNYCWLGGGGLIVNGISIPDPVNLSFTNNRFTRDNYFYPGSVNQIATGPTVTWTGNVYADNGASVPLVRV